MPTAEIHLMPFLATRHRVMVRPNRGAGGRHSAPTFGALSRFSLDRVRGPQGRAAVATAAVLWGTSGLVVSTLPGPHQPAAVGAVRLLVGGTLLLMICGLARVRHLLLNTEVWPHLALCSVAMAAYQVLYLTGIHVVGVAIGVVVSMVSVPVCVGILTIVLERRWPAPMWFVSTIVASAGCASLVFSGAGGQQVSPSGVACAVGAGGAYAVFTSTMSRQIRAGRDGAAITPVAMLGSALLLSPILVSTPMGWVATPRGLIGILYLAGVCTAMGYTFCVRGMRTVPATTVSTLFLMEPAVAAVLGILVLREPATLRTYLGLLLVAAAIVGMRPRAATGPQQSSPGAGRQATEPRR